MHGQSVNPDTAYRAVRLNRNVPGGGLSDNLPLVGDNPNFPFQYDLNKYFTVSYAQHGQNNNYFSRTINIHRSGLYDNARYTTNNPRPISKGCFLIRTSRWTELLIFKRTRQFVSV